MLHDVCMGMCGTAFERKYQIKSTIFEKPQHHIHSRSKLQNGASKDVSSKVSGAILDSWRWDVSRSLLNTQYITRVPRNMAVMIRANTVNSISPTNYDRATQSLIVLIQQVYWSFSSSKSARSWLVGRGSWRLYFREQLVVDNRLTEIRLKIAKKTQVTG